LNHKFTETLRAVESSMNDLGRLVDERAISREEAQASFAAAYKALMNVAHFTHFDRHSTQAADFEGLASQLIQIARVVDRLFDPSDELGGARVDR